MKIDIYKVYYLLGGIIQYVTMAMFIYALFGVVIWISRDALHLSPMMIRAVIIIIAMTGVISAVVDFIKGRLP